MIKWPKWLRRNVPASILTILSVLWVLLQQPIKGYLQSQLKLPPAVITVRQKAENLFQVVIGITRYSENAFEEAKVRIDLNQKVDPVDGRLFLLNGTNQLLQMELAENPPIIFVGKLESTKQPITLLQQERLEITLRAGSRQAINEIWLISKGRAPITYSDLGQRIHRVEMTWRGVLAVCLFMLAVVFREPLLRITFRKRARQLEADKEFLARCFIEDHAHLDQFDRDYQPLIDRATDRYLGLIETTVRDRLKTSVIKYEIFQRAMVLPRLGRSLRRQISFFVIKFCMLFLKRAYAAARQTAKGDRPQIK